MIEKSELLRVPVFVDLPDDQIAWFLSEVQELRLQAGETYLRQGDPGRVRHTCVRAIQRTQCLWFSKGSFRPAGNWAAKQS